MRKWVPCWDSSNYSSVSLVILLIFALLTAVSTHSCSGCGGAVVCTPATLATGHFRALSWNENVRASSLHFGVYATTGRITWMILSSEQYAFFLSGHAYTVADSNLTSTSCTEHLGRFSTPLKGPYLIITCNAFSTCEIQHFAALTDACTVQDSCNACANAASYCGWCTTSETCSSGTVNGDWRGSCNNSVWSWYSTQCATSSTAPSVDPCRIWRTCGGCTAQSSCGYCFSSDTCFTGTSFGPTGHLCSAWGWTSQYCACGAYSGNCERCAGQPTCGYCETSGHCLYGTTSGAAVGTCASPSWRFTTNSCTRVSTTRAVEIALGVVVGIAVLALCVGIGAYCMKSSTIIGGGSPVDDVAGVRTAHSHVFSQGTIVEGTVVQSFHREGDVELDPVVRGASIFLPSYPSTVTVDPQYSYYGYHPHEVGGPLEGPDQANNRNAAQTAVHDIEAVRSEQPLGYGPYPVPVDTVNSGL